VKKKNRDVQILYYNPLCHDLFVENENIELTGVMRGFRKSLYFYTVSPPKKGDALWV
jgi:hypothetical protein